MQIVIEISEDDYRKVQDGRASVSMMRKAIRNGTPFPKGHGRLIDAERYRKEMLDSREFDFFKRLDMQPTIIEADKEKLSWIGKRCEDCGNKKCKKLGTLPKGYDCALWQTESEDAE